MDLKALSTALIVAFVTVIVDAVFHFHYIYVIVVLGMLCYAFVRVLSTTRLTDTVGGIQAIPLHRLVESDDPDWPDVAVACDESRCRAAIQQLLASLNVRTHLACTVERGAGKGYVHLTFTVNRKLVPLPDGVREAITSLGQHGPVWISDVPRKTECHLLLPIA